MTKPVSGFLSKDGMFFEKMCDSHKHDAEMLIRAWCSKNDIDAEKFITYIEALADPIMEYVNASREAIEIPTIIHREVEETREANIYQGDDERTEVIDETIFEQQIDRSQSVSDLGSSPLTKGL